MRKISIILKSLLLILLLCQCKEEKEDKIALMESTVTPHEDLVKRGEYLVTTIGCADCHTPKKMTPDGPVPDMDRWMMGHPADSPLPKINPEEIKPGNWLLFNPDLTATVGPWGISFAANLTPDETGIKAWKFENFKKVLRAGKFKGIEGSRPLLPPMPWQNFSKLTDEDLLAMYEYFMSIKPIDNIVPNYIPVTEIK